MITTIVQFELPAPISLAEAKGRFEEQRTEIPEPRRPDPQILHPFRGWPHRRRRLSLGIAAGGRAGLRCRMARAGREALWRRADDHLVRHSGRRRQSRPAAPSPRRHDHAARRHARAAAPGRRPRRRAARRTPQPAARAGPLVWLDMDQQALDDAYDQLVYAPNREQVAKRRLFNSEKARAAIGAPERVAYGPTEIEQLDIYRASSRTRRSTSSSTAAPGAPTAPPTMRCWPSRSCGPAPTTSLSISSMSTMPAAACSRWSSRCGARSAGSTATPRASAAIPTGFISPRIRRARTSAAAW